MISPSAHVARIEALRRSMVDRDIDALLISGPENRRYLSGFRAMDDTIVESPGRLLITPEQSLLLTDFRYQEDAANEAPDYEVAVYKKGLADLLVELQDRFGFRKLGFETEYTTVAAHQALAKKLDMIELVPTSGLTAALRLIKSGAEIEAMEKSLAIIEAVLDRVIDRLAPGTTERQAAWWILEGLHDHGAGVGFEPIVAGGPNGAKPHATPSDRPMTEGEPIIFDVGAELDGYRSDITRTVCLGRPSGKLKEVYAVVRRAQLAALAGIKPGLTMKQADALARDVIAEAGYGPDFGHSLGHGVGLAVHEEPHLSPLKDDLLQPGMVHSVEPGIYLPGWGGVRLEVMATVTEDGCRELGRLNRFYEF